MPRYIDGDFTIEQLYKKYANSKGEARKAYSDAIDVVIAQGDIDVQEVKHGKWIKYSVDIAEHPLHCSLCGWSNYRISNREVIDFGFCPRCGQAIDWDGIDDMTCKDFIHQEVCKEDNPALCGYALVESTAKNCDYFKDKSRFVELPCKVGDPVYQVDTSGRIYESKVSEIIYSCSGFAFDKSAIGKRVLLTYEEAEKASKERKRNAEIH